MGLYDSGVQPLKCICVLLWDCECLKQRPDRGNGQCKQFCKDSLGLLKRANRKQYKRNTERSSSHTHRYHEATCFWLWWWNFFVSPQHHFAPSTRIQVLQSNFIAEFILILKNQGKKTKSIAARNESRVSLFRSMN